MKKALFIRYKKPSGVLEGGEMLSESHLRDMRSILGEENVDVEYIHDESRRRSPLDYLAGAFWMLFGYHFGLTPRRTARIVLKAMDYDILWIDRSVFGQIARKARNCGYKGKVCVFFHNVEKDYFRAKMHGKPGAGIVCRCAVINDSLSCKYADTIVALNSRDASLIGESFGRTPDVLLPIMLKDRLGDFQDCASTGRPLQCLFLGSWFRANVEGLEWFVRNVLEHVDAELTVVGKGMEKVAHEPWCTDRMKVLGSVDSIDSHILSADIMVLPIFSGSGMKVKTCESLMFGRNILGSPEAFEGYSADFSRIGGCCSTSQEFIARIKEIEANPWPRFNSYSRVVFLSNYCSDRASALWSEILR